MRRIVTTLASVAVLAACAAVLLPMVMMSGMLGGGSSDEFVLSSQVTSCALSDTGATVADLDDEQLKNARVIVAVGKALGVPERGWVIAIAAALQESGLRNLPYGDRDSRGLFQQRPSAGWGTPAQVTDPTYAARAFYGGPHSPVKNLGLLSVAGWRSMPLWQAAQTVQRSAFPMAYAAHESLAARIVSELGRGAVDCPSLQNGPWALPVSTRYTLTSSFGPRTSPTTGGSDFHTGQDFAVPTGTPARAVASGVVEFAGESGGYGNLVKVRHADGVESYYAHLSSIRVAAGDEVGPGSVVGLSGSTGNSTGPHLHLEIRVDGQPTDPMPWLRAKGLQP